MASTARRGAVAAADVLDVSGEIDRCGDSWGEDLAAVIGMITPGARARRHRDLLVYIHIPFCASKCHFCDWVVGYDKRELLDGDRLRDAYVDALCAQIDAYGPHLVALGYTVTHVYWGGGTPTRLTPEQIRRVRVSLGRAFDLSAVREHTAECSPDTVTAEHLEALLEGGLTRISVGVQSFDDGVLRRMGRIHDAAGARASLRLFAETGIVNHNADLITGFPGQDRATVLASVRQAIGLGVPHVSLYMFRDFAQSTVTARQTVNGSRRQVPRTERRDVYRAAKRMLEEAGYEEYMVGYFAAAPEFQFGGERFYFGLEGDFVGFGAGAASTLGHCALRSGDPDRYGAARLGEYLDRPLRMIGGRLASLPDAVFRDFYFKAFATREGVRYEQWRDQFGFEFQALRDARPGLREWFTEQEQAGARFVATDEALRLSDDTWVDTMMWRR